MSTAGFLALYCLMIVAASVAGGMVPMRLRLTHARLQTANSLIGGFMLGVALLHLLPHALASLPVDAAMRWTLGGLLAMFFLERLLHYHHHDAPPSPPTHASPTHALHTQPHAHAGARAPAGAGTHADTEASASGTAHPSAWSWVGVAAGLVVHSLIAGGALAAAVLAESRPSEAAWPGLALFLVIVFHKPLGAMALLTLMSARGWSAKTRHLANALFALDVPLGAAAVWLGLHTAAGGDAAAAAGLAFSAGVFLCVALSDLLPELQFHTHDRARLSIALLLGLALAWGVHHLAGRVGHDPRSSPIRQSRPLDSEKRAPRRAPPHATRWSSPTSTPSSNITKTPHRSKTPHRYRPLKFRGSWGL